MHYPDRQPNGDEAIRWAVENHDDPIEIVEFLKSYNEGAWDDLPTAFYEWCSTDPLSGE